MTLNNVTSNTILGNIPEGYRPKKHIQYKIGYNGFRFTIFPNGNISITDLPRTQEQYDIATYLNLTYVI